MNLQMEAINKRQLRVLKFLVDLFDSLKMEYVIDDGLAAAIYGSKRKLYDIDLCIEAKAMKKLKKPFNDFAIKPFAYRYYENCNLYVTTFKMNNVPIDLFTSKRLFLKSEYQKSEKLKEIKYPLKHRRTIKFKGLTIKVINPENLIVQKAFMNRKTDFQDIKAVINHTRIDKIKLLKLAKEFGVEKKINQILASRSN